jgi:hypothetical protein
MRSALIAGIVLAALGAFVLIKGLNYTREESVFKLGGVEATVKQRQAVPQWIGGVALGAGAVMIVVGLMRKR